MGCKESYCEIGPADKWSVIEQGGSKTVFRVTAGQSEAGYIKYVTWEDLAVVGDQTFSRKAANKIVVTDLEVSTEMKGYAIVGVDAAVQVI